MKVAIGTALLLVTASAAPVAAQQRDSARVLPHDPLVVTVERRESAARASVGAVSVIGVRELARRPVRTLADALQQTPGIAFVDFEGTGADPQLMMRGFYGGGEAEYALLLLDGQPLNSLETGRINWELIPLAAIETIEVVRGPASTAWGDAAVGGVINVITRPGAGAAWRGSVSGGAHDQLRGAGSWSGTIGQQAATGFGHYHRSDGFRDHAERTAAGGSATVGLVGTNERGLSLSLFSDWREYEEPGPLTDAELSVSRTQSSPFYEADNVDEQLHRLSLLGNSPLASSLRMRVSVTGEYRDASRNRSLRLTPDFADHKERELTTRRVHGSAQLELELPRGEPLLVGVDASWGDADSKYFRTDETGGGSSRVLDSRADGVRRSIAGFTRYSLTATSALRISLGARFDWLEDSFEIGAPEESTSHTAFSPMAGVNLGYAASATQRGHLYANIARAFKAPTPDQLYDQRRVPVPFPPFAVTFSNADLKPQRGTSIETGIYHDALFFDENLSAALSLSAYQFDLKDEIDFDVTTLGYRNIGRSRHRGVEAGINLELPRSIHGFANYTLQAVTARAGDNAGNYLKAIPRHYITAGLGLGGGTGLSGTVTVTHAQRMYLDDANTRTLPDWTRWDARAAYSWRGLQLFADVLNLADAEYSTTGFPDPAGSAVVFYYPAAGRMLNLGVSMQH